MCTRGYHRVTIARTLLAGLAVLLSLLATQASPAAAAAPVPDEHALYTDAPNGMFLLAQNWSTRPDPHDAGLHAGWAQAGYSDGFDPVAVPNAFNARDLSKRSFAG